MTDDSNQRSSGNEQPATDGIGQKVRRRDVMKAAGAAGVIGAGFVGTASAQDPDDCADVQGACDDCVDTGCTATRGSCTSCLTEGCEEISDTRLEAGRDFDNGQHCLEVSAEDIPDDASKAVIKAANNCHECEIVDPTQSQTFCIDGQHAISHIEFADCPSADVTVDCPEDQARVDVENTDSVYYAVEYQHCDEEDASGTLTFSEDAAGGESGEWFTYVDIADCEGTITVYTEQDGDELDSADFDCETATVEVACPPEADEPTATICSDDTSEVFYTVEYDDCDEADVEDGSVDLSGDTDCVEVELAACDGTITIYDDDDRFLGSAEIDCAAGSVTVECPPEADEPTATICSEDTSEVFYTVEYVDCDEADVEDGSVDLSGDTDCADVALAACDGTITIYDAEGDELDSAEIDCAAGTVTVECPSADGVEQTTATICSEDTSEVFYTVEYAEECEADDEENVSVDLSGDTDCAEVELAACDGTITIYDAEGDELATEDFECAPAPDCPECPEGLAVKFEDNEIREGYSEGGFTVTFVDDENDPKNICVTSDTPYCELKVCVKAGQNTGAALVEPNEDGEYCFSVRDATDQSKNAISHFTIRCPDSDCVFTGPGSA